MTEQLQGFQRSWEDLGGGITFSPEFNAEPIRRSLGLDGHAPDKSLTSQDRKRLAEMLQRAGRLSKQDLISMRAFLRVKPAATARQEGSGGRDLVPGSRNKQLQR